MNEADHHNFETLVVAKRPLVPGGMKEMLRLAWPVAAAFMTNVAMGFADTIMVARVGPGAVGAVTTSALLFHALTAFCGGLIGAVVTFTSQSHSRGDDQDGARYAWQGIYLGLAFGVAGLALLPLVARFFAGHGESVEGMEIAYTSYRLPSMLFMMTCWSLRSFFQGLGRTKLILAIALAANALNVLMNYLLIFGVGPFPQMGVAGAGLATTLSNVVALGLFAIPFLFGRAARENRTRRSAAFSWPRLVGLLRIGIPTSWQWSLDVLAWGIWHTWLVGRLGTAALDANGIVMEIGAMAWFPMIGVGHAACTLTGFYLARRQVARARRAARSAMGLTTLYMSLISVAMFFFAEDLMHLFLMLQKGQATRTMSEVVALGATALRIAAIWQIFDGICIALMGALRGGGDTLWPAVAQLMLTWGFFLPLAWLLCFGLNLGMPGAWWAGVAQLGLLAAVVTYRYRGKAWTRKNIFRDRTDMA
ncbi:MAG: MATE family efflux transporter [Anaerolineaceae bacterium]|nr:MATE family efflux transporter [Anaerolineaceae bacterium]